MGLFHAVAGALALLAAIVLIRPLIAARGDVPARGARDAQLYRDQLDEIDRDLERGTIGASEAEGARAEISRRLLGATARAGDEAPAAPAPRGTSVLLAGLALVGAPALAFGIYASLGAPSLPDQPFADRIAAPALADRPSQAQAEAAFAPEPASPPADGGKDYAELVAQLESMVAQRPDDVEGRRLLANAYMRLGRHGEAWRAYEALIALLGGAAEPDLFGMQTEAMVMAAGGYISPEAEQVLADAVHHTPSAPSVRYYTGLLQAQYGDIPGAIATWQKLRDEAPADAPWAQFLDGMLAAARAALAGPGQQAPGPSAAEVEAAGSMSPEERQAMIGSMVARLEDRLTTEGGTVEEWLRLINAYVQLGKPDEARRAYALGAAALDGTTEAGALREQALVMGVISE
jgi:cytochrome c-type biogenesis protein CcmH